MGVRVLAVVQLLALVAIVASQLPPSRPRTSPPPPPPRTPPPPPPPRTPPPPPPPRTPPPPPPPPPIRCRYNSDCPEGFRCRQFVCVNRTSSCFPGDALVHMPLGAMKPMQELAVGDKVAVGKDRKGMMVYSDVYAFGHKDASAFADFFKIKMESAVGTLELTRGHFVPTTTETEGNILYKRAEELKVGDIMLAATGNSSLLPSAITEISMVEKEGLFNPLTLSGSILVDGVMASVHSDWFLDSIFDAMGVTHWLPYAYQALLSPVRCLYSIFGKEVYATVYAVFDGYVNVAEFGSEHGGMVTLTIVIAALAAATKPLLKTN